MKIKDLKEGMQDVSFEAEIDYIVPMNKRGYGEKWGIVFVKDDTKDVKMLFYGDDMKKVEEGKKIKVEHAYVTTYRGEIQVNTKKDHPIKFLE